MIAGRRVARPRHEFRFGTRELALLAATILVVAGLTFVFGMLVGREMTGPARAPRAGVGAPGRAEPGPASVPNAPSAKIAAAKPEERLTFYRTLTAPTTDFPAVGPPIIEERMVPREEPSPPAAKPEARPTPPPKRAGTSPGTTVATRPPVAAIHPAPEPASAPAAPGEPAPWTVQVSSFRSRTLAEELRGRLAGRGFDAYLLSAATEEGRVRYRVRVGSFPSRAEAERVAADLRTERGLSPYVTPRPR